MAGKEGEEDMTDLRGLAARWAPAGGWMGYTAILNACKAWGCFP